MNTSVMKNLVGRKVSVYSMANNGARDDGVIQSYDDLCVVLERNSEILVFVWANVRLIKVLE